MEKNTFAYALNYNCSPDSLSRMSVPHFLRLIDFAIAREKAIQTPEHTESVETSTED